MKATKNIFSQFLEELEKEFKSPDVDDYQTNDAEEEYTQMKDEDNYSLKDFDNRSSQMANEVVEASVAMVDQAPEDLMDPNKYQSEQLRDALIDFDPKKAIIYSEIINPKYF